MKYTLHTAPIDRGPFNCRPAMTWELDEDRILCNDVRLPWESNYHGTRLWVIWNEFGPLFALWADNEQDALDSMVDEGMGDSFLVDADRIEEATDEERDEWAQLGNAGEYCDLTYCGMAPVVFDEARDCRLLCEFAEARGAGQKTLYS